MTGLEPTIYILWIRHFVDTPIFTSLTWWKKKYRSWQDSNLQSPDPKSGALSIRPHDPRQRRISILFEILALNKLAGLTEIHGRQIPQWTLFVKYLYDLSAYLIFFSKFRGGTWVVWPNGKGTRLRIWGLQVRVLSRSVYTYFSSYELKIMYFVCLAGISACFFTYTSDKNYGFYR